MTDILASRSYRNHTINRGGHPRGCNIPLGEPQVLRPFIRDEVVSIGEAALIAGRAKRTVPSNGACFTISVVASSDSGRSQRSPSRCFWTPIRPLSTSTSAATATLKQSPPTIHGSEYRCRDEGSSEVLAGHDCR